MMMQRAQVSGSLVGLYRSLKWLAELGSLGRVISAPTASTAAPLAIESLLVDGDERPLRDRIGPYQLVRRLSGGGMAKVLLARKDSDWVAIKIARSGLLRPAFSTRLENERCILGRLDHPNVVTLLGSGVCDRGVPFIVLEYVCGVPMDLFMEEENLTLEARLRLFLQLCEALEYVHSCNVLHLDLKPSNILVTENSEVKVVDFGIGKLAAGQDQKSYSESCTVFLTRGFASPEQLRGDFVSSASDIFSLGMILSDLFVGWQLGQTGDMPPATSEKDSAWSRGLRSICRKCVEEDPGNRYASVLGLREEVSRILDLIER